MPSASAMLRYVVSLSLLITGIIHLLPLSGVLGGERLEALYGVTPESPEILLLLRHRAVLFGLLGVFMLMAAFRTRLQTPAFAAGFISVLSFLWLSWLEGSYNSQIARVVAADLVALACLLAGVAARIRLSLRS